LLFIIYYLICFTIILSCRHRNEYAKRLNNTLVGPQKGRYMGANVEVKGGTGQ